MEARLRADKLLQWVAFTTRTAMQDAPPTEVVMQKSLCFRPVAVDGLPGPLSPTYDIMPSDEAVLDFINRCGTVSTCKHQIDLFHALHGVDKQVMKKAKGESTSTTTYYYYLLLLTSYYLLATTY